MSKQGIQSMIVDGMEYHVGRKVRYTNRFGQTLEGRIIRLWPVEETTPSGIVIEGWIIVQRPNWIGEEAVHPRQYERFEQLPQTYSVRVCIAQQDNPAYLRMRRLLELLTATECLSDPKRIQWQEVQNDNDDFVEIRLSGLSDRERAMWAKIGWMNVTWMEE